MDYARRRHTGPSGEKKEETIIAKKSFFEGRLGFRPSDPER